MAWYLINKEKKYFADHYITEKWKYSFRIEVL